MRDNSSNIVDKFCQSKAIRNTNGVLSKPFVCSTNRMPWTNMRSKAKSAPKSHISKQRTHADKGNTEALQTELNSQAQLYADDKNVAIETVNVKMLENDKYLTEKQAEKMQAKHLEPETYGKSESK